jgi:hypothetical protein
VTSSDEQGFGTLVETRRSIARLQPTNKQKENISWINLGRDYQLETEIINRIEKRLNTKREQNK